ncbi:helix-turn-helix domain-containing protein [Nitrospirillum pindoramense]|nr:helix-turn-helix transcriptional regulator [Nitrospirillum amazonense]
METVEEFAPKLETPDGATIAFFVACSRRMMGWQVKTLAHQAGVSVSSIERIERGVTVSPEVLDRVAAALKQKPGAFTQPRVRLSKEEALKHLEAQAAPWLESVELKVAPLRKAAQLRRMAEQLLLLVDGSGLGEDFGERIDGVKEWFELLQHCINGPVTDLSEMKGRKRSLYGRILSTVTGIERDAHAVALAGTYVAEGLYNDGARLTVPVAVLSFRPLSGDPGARKRTHLYAPRQIEINKILAAWLAEDG